MKDTKNKSNAARKPNFDIPEADKSRLIKWAESWPTSSGRTKFLLFLQGKKLTYMEGALAKCAECNNGYLDGRYDCGRLECPLYQFMPYKGTLPKNDF